MPDKPKEKAIAEAFLKWYNPNHASRFGITGWPDESCSVWDLDAVCSLSDRRMAIEVGQAEVGHVQDLFPLHDKWKGEFDEVASKRKELRGGLWALAFSDRPPDGLSARQRRRFISLVLDDLAPHLEAWPGGPNRVPLPLTAGSFPCLAGLTVRVALRQAQSSFCPDPSWAWGPGWINALEELLRASVLEEARRKFASAPAGATRVVLLWSATLADTVELAMPEVKEFLAVEAPPHNVDALYLIEWHEPGLGVAVPGRILALFEKEEQE